MKKLFTTLTSFLIGAVLYAQIDTVFVRYVEWKGEEWWWGVAGLNPANMDSADRKQYKKLIRSIELANPVSGSNFTYDSLPGKFAMKFYRDYWSDPSARENMGQGIDQRCKASLQLAPYVAQADAARLSRFEARKREGKLTTN